MADSSKSSTDSSASRRNFLKIGAGVVAGAAVASVVEIPYYSSVVGGNNSSSSSTVSSLNDQLNSTASQLSDTQSALAATQSQLTDTQGSLSAANNTIGGLNSQITSSSQALSSANQQLTATQSSLSAANAAKTSLSSQLTSTQSSLQSATGTITTLQSTVSSQSSEIGSLQSQVSGLAQLTAFQFFNPAEQAEVAALAEAMIPTDATGPGANEAGVIYFIDAQLAGDYGYNANMYLQGPYIQPGISGSITVQGVTYLGGSAPSRLTAGGGYQYPLKWQEFWRACLQWTEDYSNSAYGNNFESLSAANQTAVLTDLWGNKPTNFVGITPQAWFSELHDMVWAGFFTDPIYQGNRGMVGWVLTGFTGTNQGNAYGEGYTTQQLMLMTTPVRLQPQSLAQFQQQAGELPGGQ